MSGAGRFELERALDRAAGARAIPGNRLALLSSGPAIFRAIEALIARASRSIHFENYIIRSDATGWKVAEALAARARSGIVVRVLFDAVGSRGTSRKLWRALAGSGVEVRRFRPVLGTGFLRGFQRNHRKLVAVDGREALTGGFCIGDEWSGADGDPRGPWRDTAVHVEGPAARAADLSFRRTWALAGPPIAEGLEPPREEPAGEAVVRVVEGIPGLSRIYRALSVLLAGVAERLWITDPYFVPLPPLMASLIAAARDGVDVRLLLPGRTDLPVIRLFTRTGYRDLLRGGLRIYEWQGPMLHAKTILLDGVWTRVGSSNINVSSLFGNFELDLLAEDRRLAAALADQFRRDLASAAEIVLEPRRGLPPRVRPSEEAALVRPGPPSMRAARRAAVLTFRQVAAGARRSLVGAAVFALTGAGVLLVALPRFTAWLLAGCAFWLAGSAAWSGLLRRRHTRV